MHNYTLMLSFLCFPSSDTMHACQTHTQNMRLQAIVYVHFDSLFIFKAVMGSEGTISLHRVTQQGSRHWFCSGVG